MAASMLNAPPAFQVMLKPSGAQCNLGCEYCYFLKKAGMYPGSDFRMSEQVLESFTRQYIQAQRVPQVTFAWQGGEPTLMGLDFFERAVAYQQQYAPPGMRVENAIQTNGTLLDDAWCAFFKQHGFLVGISIDGPQALHDAYRKDKAGKSSFGRVMRGLELLQKHAIEYNILACVHAGNAAYPLEVYRFFRDEIGAHFLQFIPIVERVNKTGEQKGNKVSKRSVTGRQYGEFLSRIFDEWVRRDVGEVFVQIFDVALGKWLGGAGGLCVFEETCGSALALEHNGDLYACDHFVEPRYRLGNILQTEMAQLVGSHKQRTFGLEKRSTLPRYCQICEVRFACNGGCPKNRFRHTPDGEYRLNYLCEGYKAFFSHIDPDMHTMSGLIRRGRPPAEILPNPPDKAS
jgi:uncharacterized protein